GSDVERADDRVPRPSRCEGQRREGGRAHPRRARARPRRQTARLTGTPVAPVNDGPALAGPYHTRYERRSPMAGAFLIGRLIFGAFFVFNAVNLLISLGAAAQYAAAKGVPLPEVAVAGAGLLILFGGTSILLGWRPELGVAAIVVFLLGVSFPM